MVKLKLPESEHPLVKSMTGSVNGHLIQIIYSIKIFVKHDTMQQFGEGACVTQQIKVIETRKPEGEYYFNKNAPVLGDPLSQKYYNNYVKNFEGHWQSACPVVMTEKDIKEEEQEI